MGRKSLGILSQSLLTVFLFLVGALNTGLAAAYAPRWSLAVAMLTYFVQVAGLALVLTWLARRDVGADVLNPGWLGGAVIVGTLAWTSALVVGTLRDPEVQR